MTVETTPHDDAMQTTDFRFVVGDGSDHVVLEFDTPAEQTEVYLTKGQLERLLLEADTAVEKLKCREKLGESGS
ncbi:MAG: hypothetical protein ACRECX_10755 [Methyloceanibacter sp.]|uniref:hypothetical protein n=1 Tax=Methyloceanibacter sp. TaxID=1965321 RepID=UPI003D6CDB54